MATQTSPVTANFPFPVLTPFATDIQPPTFTTLQQLQREINGNAMSVHSHAGGGNHGHLTLTITAAQYLALTNVPFPPPVAPPPAPLIPQPSMAVQAAELV
jgi:hypothetical protein